MTTRTFHCAVIMDGNGRWAAQRGLPRLAGHRRGAAVLRRIVEAAPGLGIDVLTVYAFSSDNWQRPPAEVDGLMALFARMLDREAKRLAAKGVRLNVIGRRDRLPLPLVGKIEECERRTAGGERLHLRVAVDYSSRDALLAAAGACDGRFDRATLAHAMGAIDVDLLVRTGGEQRLSDFLLWECAYAEFWFDAHLWPDFTPAALAQAVAAFRGRARRFGSLPAA